MKKSWIITLAALVLLALGGYLLWPYAFTVVSIQSVEAAVQSEAFDPVAFVDGIWASRMLPTFESEAKDLPAVLNEIEPDAKGMAAKEDLVDIAKKYGLITVGEAHVYMVKGSGTITSVDVSKSTGVAEVKLDGYDGPIKVRLYIGSRIPSDESSVRDAVGFITFGDFKEQTEYGKVAAELNKRVLAETLKPLSRDQLQGKSVSFYGAFTIRTFNLITINVTQVSVVPVKIEVK